MSHRRCLFVGLTLTVLLAVGISIAREQSQPHEAAATEPTSGESASSQPVVPDDAVTVPDPDLSGAEPQVAEALQKARLAVLADPRTAKAWGQFAVLCDAHSLLEAADECYEMAHRLDPGDRRWVYLQAVVKNALGAGLDQTLPLFQRASELMPEFPAVWIRIGEVYAAHGKLAEAADAYREAVRRFPNVAIAHRNLGQTLQQLGDTKAALEALQEADRLAPNDRLVNVALSQAYLRLGENQRADECDAKSRQCDDVIRMPDPMQYQVRALCLTTFQCKKNAVTFLADRDWKRAVRALSIVVDNMPNDGLAHSQLGLALLELGETDEARLMLDRSLKLNPDTAEEHAALGALLEQFGRTAEALDHYRKAVALDPKSPAAARLQNVATTQSSQPAR